MVQPVGNPTPQPVEPQGADENGLTLDKATQAVVTILGPGIVNFASAFMMDVPKNV